MPEARVVCAEFRSATLPEAQTQRPRLLLWEVGGDLGRYRYLRRWQGARLPIDVESIRYVSPERIPGVDTEEYRLGYIHLQETHRLR